MNKNRLDSSDFSRILTLAIRNGWISDEDSSVIFHDLLFLRRKIERLKQNFPDDTLHAIAAKANPLPKILEFLKPMGVGVEAATIGEVFLAQKTGYKPDNIVFDSPAKTKNELELALKAGIYINADSFEELKRIDNLKKIISSNSRIGIRVNPQVGKGKIAATSVAGEYSKFGLPLKEKWNDLITAFSTYEWLEGVHAHIGSQGCSLRQLIAAARQLMDFVSKVNRENNKQIIKTIDIGGGLPVVYEAKNHPPTLEEYSQALKENCPELFTGEYKIITEFGRYIHANAGFTASRVEYVKSYGGTKTAVIHVGADLLMRHCYMPQDWPHEISVADSGGQLKTSGQTDKYVIAGPLCFGGDIIAREIELPVLQEGDYILIHDTGGYTLSLWNRHTSRLIPKVLGYNDQNKEFTILKKRETLDELYRFWI